MNVTLQERKERELERTQKTMETIIGKLIKEREKGR
jgi:hypothetical protein